MRSKAPKPAKQTKAKKKAQADGGVTKDEFPRRVPALITYLHPFRIVEADNTTPWNVTIEAVNGQSWNYVALHEIAGGAEVGLPRPYHLVIVRDGALALPPIPELRNDQIVVEFFNKCLAALLLGGVYCEAITRDSLEAGSIIDWKYLRVSTDGEAGPNRFHKLIRMQAASPLEAISLLNPRTIHVNVLTTAMGVGLGVLSRIPRMSGEFLLKGATGIARRDWGTALASLWIIVEQLTSHLWAESVLRFAKGTAIEGRKEQLEDARTWTTATRQELLFQKAVLDAETLRYLSAARKARNNLVHRGMHPPEKAALSCYTAVLNLLKICLPDAALPLFDIDLQNHALSDPFKPVAPKEIEPLYWHDIPKLPGEAALEKAEAAKFAKQLSKSEPKPSSRSKREKG